MTVQKEKRKAGRPKGATSSRTNYVRLLFHQALFGDGSKEDIVARIKSDIASNPKLLLLAFHYVFGKPAQIIDLGSEMSEVEEPEIDLSKLSYEQRKELERLCGAIEEILSPIVVEASAKE